jgi:hypothetical protein
MCNAFNIFFGSGQIIKGYDMNDNHVLTEYMVMGYDHVTTNTKVLQDQIDEENSRKNTK